MTGTDGPPRFDALKALRHGVLDVLAARWEPPTALQVSYRQERPGYYVVSITATSGAALARLGLDAHGLGQSIEGACQNAWTKFNERLEQAVARAALATGAASDEMHRAEAARRAAFNGGAGLRAAGCGHGAVLIALRADRVWLVATDDGVSLPTLRQRGDQSANDVIEQDARERWGLVMRHAGGPLGSVFREDAIWLYCGVEFDGEPAPARAVERSWWGDPAELLTTRYLRDHAAVMRATICREVMRAVAEERAETLKVFGEVRDALASRERPRTVEMIRKHGWGPSVAVGDGIATVRAFDRVRYDAWRDG